MNMDSILAKVKEHQNCLFCGKRLTHTPCNCSGAIANRQLIKDNEQYAIIKKQEALIKDRLSRIKIPKRYTGVSLKDFNLNTLGIKKYIENLQINLKNGIGLVIYGSPGTGKTRLSFAIGIAAIYAGFNFTRLKLHSIIQDELSSSNKLGLLQSAINAQVLLLDDVGLKGLKEWEQLKVYEIIDHRNEELLPTIITTNLGLELQAFLGSICYDRLVENSLFVCVKGQSKRKLR